MTPDKFIEFSANTDLDNEQYHLAGLRSREEIGFLHVALGVASESGELVDILKKYIFYGKKIDITNFEEELGDLLWYISLACRLTDISFERLMEMNYNKLKTRYPDKFTEELALNRDLDKERKVLEG